MKKQNVWILVALWSILTAFAWFSSPKEISQAERRPLAQRPALQGSSLLSGEYMKDFEAYSLDQFPLRDAFRSLKARFHTNVLGARDNNGLYIVDGYAVKQEYPLNRESLDHAVKRFDYLYEKFLTGSGNIHMTIVPDKGHYFAKDSGHLTLSTEEMMAYFEKRLPWMHQIDLTPALQADSYYRTDTHWKQEALIPAAQTIAQALGVTCSGNFRVTEMEQPFYGVYYGQSALPLQPDTICLLENDILNGCSVYDYETKKTGKLYDLEKLTGKDSYEVYLSGAKSLLTIVNPAADSDRELLIFRDSFGSAIAPLLLENYAKVTLVDIRYVQIDILDRFLEFHGQDVLFLYSTLVLNNSQTLK